MLPFLGLTYNCPVLVAWQFSETPLLEIAEFKGYGALLALILRGMTDGSSSAASSITAMILQIGRAHV